MPRSWIFQANPSVYRVRDALATLKQFTWSVNQHRAEIHVGDTVYLWESGPTGGLLANALVATEPELRIDTPREMEFFANPPVAQPRLAVELTIGSVFPEPLSRPDLGSEPSLVDLRILRAPQGTNFALTEAEARTLQRLTETRPSFARVIERYQGDGVVFQSVERSALYAIAAVDDSGCEVHRLTAQEPARVTISLHDTRRRDIESSGGRLPTPKLDGTAAVRATLVQSPWMGLTPDRREVIVLNDEDSALELFCQLLRTLNVHREGDEPKLYKPALIACVVDAVAEGQFADHRINFDAILPRFKGKLEQLGRSANSDQAVVAFYHLTNDLFWNLAYVDVNDRLDPENLSPGILRRKVKHAVLKEPFRWLLRKHVNRERVLETLRSAWWPNEDPQMSKTQFWWVNQGGSYDKERENGTIWCPQVGKTGNSPRHWTNLSKTRKGDVVFHYVKGDIRAVSVTATDPGEGNKPQSIAIKDEWQQPGWFAKVDYHDLVPAVDHSAIKEMLRRTEIASGPFNSSGGVNQGYLFPLNDRAVALLAEQVVLEDLPDNIASKLREAVKRQWDLFIHWGRRYFETGSIRADERKWKLDAAAVVGEARQAMTLRLENWLDGVRRAFGKSQGATDYRAHDDLLKWWGEHREEATKALQAIWDHGATPQICIERFWDAMPTDVVSGMGTRTNIASFLIAERDPTQFPLYKFEPFTLAFSLTGAWRKTATPAETYDTALAFLDRVRQEASARGLELPDRLDAQSLMWCVVKREPPQEWSESDRQALLKYRAGEFPAEAVRPEVPAAVNSSNPIEELADRLLLPPQFLSEASQLLSAKRQIVFFGPPGTGKTFVARELARHFAGDDGSFEIIQFHPSYTYEDFVEGFRPRQAGKDVGFELVRGPLLRMARRARKSSGNHILVIDELNRGNIAKVFGELYFLLEYRDEQIRLQYDHKKRFSLPKNLWIIGTMNTADRSIALIDAALRRRFFFLPFFPDEVPIKGLLKRWLERHRPGMAWVADVVDHANVLLGDRHGAIGPSHFMRADLDEKWLALIWKHSVMPYLAEQFFGEEDRLKEFELPVLRNRVDGPESAVK